MQAWFKCIIIAFALIIVAWIIEASNALFTGSGSTWVVLVYYVGLTVIIGSIIWFILYVSPNLIQSLIKTAGDPLKPTQNPEHQKNNTQQPQTQIVTEESTPVKWVPVRQETPAPSQDETDSERLRREFRRRGF